VHPRRRCLHNGEERKRRGGHDDFDDAGRGPLHLSRRKDDREHPDGEDASGPRRSGVRVISAVAVAAVQARAVTAGARTTARTLLWVVHHVRGNPIATSTGTTNASRIIGSATL
jgi:hypothetical protein